jgi:hypothetical protein
MPPLCLIIYFCMISDQNTTTSGYQNPADTASTGKTFTISPFIHLSSAFILDWPVAEEVLTDQVVGSSAQTQDPAPASPRAQPASPQLEVSVSLGHSASPQPAIQELSAEPERSSSPMREARNDVSIKIHPFILSNNFIINSVSFFFPGENCITQFLFCC